MASKTFRILFVTDLHGSEKCWRKFLEVGNRFKVDCMIAAGDLTGKVIAPIIRIEENLHKCRIFGHEYELHNENEIAIMEQKIRDTGYYPYRCNLKRAEELNENKKELDKLFDELMRESVKKWLDLTTDKIDKNVRLIVNPGNDDRFVVDDIIEEHEGLIYPLGKVVHLNDKYEMVSCEWVNITPWNSPRECSEEELMKKLEKEIGRLNHFENAVFNFHAPPYDTSLDKAPKVGKDLKPVTMLGMPQTESVGSRSVKDVIEKYQPFMGLHGHIHESSGKQKIGRTVCLNPGSEYASGLLRFLLIALNKKVEYWPREF